jgi:hypothetical protein
MAATHIRLSGLSKILTRDAAKPGFVRTWCGKQVKVYNTTSVARNATCSLCKRKAP